MIRNVYGKAVTESTVRALPEHQRGREVSAEDMARVALRLKNSQGKEDEENERYVERLRNKCVQEKRISTMGLVYNGTGGALTLVSSRNWAGCLDSSNPYPVRIENGQWGMFLHTKKNYGGSSGAVVYEVFNLDRKRCYWCVAWKNKDEGFSQVGVKIVRDVDWKEGEWNKMQNWASASQHRAVQEGLFSVISATPPPQVIFEALLTMEHL